MTTAFEINTAPGSLGRHLRLNFLCLVLWMRPSTSVFFHIRTTNSFFVVSFFWDDDWFLLISPKWASMGRVFCCWHVFFWHWFYFLIFWTFIKPRIFIRFHFYPLQNARKQNIFLFLSQEGCSVPWRPWPIKPRRPYLQGTAWWREVCCNSFQANVFLFFFQKWRRKSSRPIEGVFGRHSQSCLKKNCSEAWSQVSKWNKLFELASRSMKSFHGEKWALTNLSNHFPFLFVVTFPMIESCLWLVWISMKLDTPHNIIIRQELRNFQRLIQKCWWFVCVICFV